MDYLDFLSNGGTDFKGRTLESIWSFTDQQIESTHDFVQIIFPLDKPSRSTFHGHYLDSKDTINKIKDNFGGLHIAVNCAGTGYPGRILGKEAPHPLDAFQFIVNLNLVGTFNVMRIAAELMDKNEPDEKGEKGVIINTASIAGIEGQIGQSAYSASKAGVIGLTITAARDLARHAIRVCTIAPGIFDTPLMQLASDKVRDPLLESTQFPHRFGQPNEFADLAVHIVENTYLNGETIRLDSGMRMKPR